MRISDWSSDVCSSDLVRDGVEVGADAEPVDLEVVAHVDDGRDLGGRHDADQSGQEAGRPDATREDGDQLMHLSRPERSSMSASTIIVTRSSKLVRRFPPRTLSALLGSPMSTSTSAGRLTSSLSAT